MKEKSLDNNEPNCQEEDQTYANENMILIIGDDGTVTDIKRKINRIETKKL